MTKVKAAQAANKETEIKDSVTSNTDTVVVTVKANSIQIQTKPLTAAEAKRLAECEAIVEKSKKEFMKGWEALMCISEEGLYRATHSTFEQYCREKWGITARYANRLMLADAVMENIKSEQLVSSEPAAVPENEAQARPLAVLTPPQQIEAAKIVAKKTGKHTAKDFANAADKVTGKKAKADKPEKASGESGDEDPRGKNNVPSTTGTNTSLSKKLKAGQERIVLITEEGKDMSELWDALDYAGGCINRALADKKMVQAYDDAMAIVTYFLNQLTTPDEEMAIEVTTTNEVGAEAND